MFPFDNPWEGVAYDEYGAAIDPAEFDLSLGDKTGGSSLA